MPYNRNIEASINKATQRWKGVGSKKMFGGVCCLLNGNMFCGVYKDFLILRLGEKQATAAMQEPLVKAFDITGKPMKGWVMVTEEGFKTDGELISWLEEARSFVKTLPAK
jgi:TfoX/Sxy family transcriptional regulator of competence genes